MDPPSASQITLPTDLILSLPEELLQACLRTYVEADYNEIPRDDDSETSGSVCHRDQRLLGLCRVCKRFAAVARPMLFNEVCLPLWFRNHTTQEKQDRRTELFLRTFSGASDVARFVRRLEIPANILGRLAVVNPGALAQLTTLTELILTALSEACPDYDQWALFAESLAQLPRLGTLSLEDFAKEERRFSRLTPVLLHLQTVSKLILAGIECPQPPCEEVSHWPIPNHPGIMEKRLKDEAASFPPEGLDGTAGFEELHLVRCSHISPVSLQNFLYWSSGLKRLEIDSIGLGDYDIEDLMQMGVLSYPWTWHVLRETLLPHSKHLQELRVGQITTQEGLDSFSLHDFPDLHTFQTYWSSMGPAPEEAAELWLTPSLKLLVLDSATDRSQAGKIYGFDQSEMEWLIKFARVIARRRAAGQFIALERIQILFIMHHGYYSMPNDENIEEHAYTLLPKAKAEVERLGLQMTCPVLKLYPLSPEDWPTFPETFEELLESPFEWDG